MRFIFKIIAIPFVVVLTIVTALLNFLFCLSAGVFIVAAFILGLGGFGVLLSGDTFGGIVLIVMGLLVSPFGLPAAAEWFVDKLDDWNYSLKGFITG